MTCGPESLLNTSAEPTLHNPDCDSNSSERRSSLPGYDICQSKQISNQQKGLGWLTLSSKEKYDSTYTALLARWGRTVNHVGTCLLIPEDWRSADPLDLMALFSSENIPIAGSPRASFSYGDHQTSLVRAKAWYTQWPRTGLDLDNLLGCGPYKPMDASHLCHHEHCVIHIVYEPADINESRKACLRRARFLRSEKRPVPAECDLHDPPCMMQVRFFVAVPLFFANSNQHAALISSESYRHQFQILAEVNGLPPPKPLPRPRRYPYPTFESLLPSQYPAVAINRNELVFGSSTSVKEGRPNLICDFCSSVRLKSYASIVGLWAHMVHEHQEVDNADRLHEIKRTAMLWWNYWKSCSEGGKRHNLTLAKLEQTQQLGFSWTDVMKWSLRSAL